MTGWRAGLAAVVVIALAVAVWAALSPDDEPVPTMLASPTTVPPTSNTTAPTTTPTPTPTPTPTTDAPVTSTVAPGTTLDADARTEEVRLILEDLYFRWFDAIYHNDEEAVREVVAMQRRLDNFRRAVDEIDLPRAPIRGEVVVVAIDVLRDTEDCIVTFSEVDQTEWRGSETRSSVVDVLWIHGAEWRFATSWQNPGDLWEGDCDASRSDELP